jgi:hypothetical protein
MFPHRGDVEGDGFLVSMPGGEEQCDLLFYVIEVCASDCS